jgi:hypothetical protein
VRAIHLAFLGSRVVMGHCSLRFRPGWRKIMLRILATMLLVKPLLRNRRRAKKWEDEIKVDQINKYFLLMGDGFTLLKIVFAGALLC